MATRQTFGDFRKVWLYKGDVYCTHKQLQGVYKLKIQNITKVRYNG